MSDNLNEIRQARAAMDEAQAALDAAQARFDAAVVHAMRNRIVGQTTANDIAQAAGWSSARLYQFLKSARAA